jgi:hypothetical protein
MAILPASGDFSNAANTEITQKNLWERHRDVTSELPGGENIETLVLDAGDTVVPTRGMIAVDTFGGVGPDDLVTITTTNHPEGRMLWIRATDIARVITAKDGVGAGKIALANNADFVMDALDKWLLVMRVGTQWVEIHRFFGVDFAGFKTWFGFGDAADGDQGHGNGFDADTLDLLHATDFLGVLATAADSSKLGGFFASEYLRLTDASIQTMDGKLQIEDDRMRVNSLILLAPGYELLVAGVRRGLLHWDDTQKSVTMQTFDPVGAVTNNRRFRITHSGNAEFWNGAAWIEVFTNTGQINADDSTLFGGYTPANLPFKASNFIAGAPGSGNSSGTIPAGSSVNISMNRFSSFPSVEITQGAVPDVHMTPYGVPLPDVPGASTTSKFGIYNNDSTGRDYYVSWEYPS